MRSFNFARPVAFIVWLTCQSSVLTVGQAHARVDDSSLGRKLRWGGFVEPSLGLVTGSYTNDVLGVLPNAADKAGVLGPGFGLRVGALYDYYFIALDAEYQKLNNFLFPSSFGNFMLGITAGGTLGQYPIRILLGIRVIDSLSMTGFPSLPANSAKIGVSYFPIPLLAINVELSVRSYGQVNLGGTLTTPSYESAYFSVSLPFTFFGPTSMPEFARWRMKVSEEVSPFDWNTH